MEVSQSKRTPSTNTGTITREGESAKAIVSAQTCWSPAMAAKSMKFSGDDLGATPRWERGVAEGEGDGGEQPVEGVEAPGEGVEAPGAAGGLDLAYINSMKHLKKSTNYQIIKAI